MARKWAIGFWVGLGVISFGCNTGNIEIIQWIYIGWQKVL